MIVRKLFSSAKQDNWEIRCWKTEPKKVIVLDSHRWLKRTFEKDDNFFGSEIELLSCFLHNNNMTNYRIEIKTLSDLFNKIDKGQIIFDCFDGTDELWILELLQDLVLGHYHHITVELQIQPYEDITDVLTGVCTDEVLFALRECFKRREGEFQYCVDVKDSTVSLSQPNFKMGILPLFFVMYGVTDLTEDEINEFEDNGYTCYTHLQKSQCRQSIETTKFSVVSIFPTRVN